MGRGGGDQERSREIERDLRSSLGTCLLCSTISSFPWVTFYKPSGLPYKREVITSVLLRDLIWVKLNAPLSFIKKKKKKVSTGLVRPLREQRGSPPRLMTSV